MVDWVFKVGKLVLNRAPSLAGGSLRLHIHMRQYHGLIAENPPTHLANDSSYLVKLLT